MSTEWTRDRAGTDHRGVGTEWIGGPGVGRYGDVGVGGGLGGGGYPGWVV